MSEYKTVDSLTELEHIRHRPELYIGTKNSIVPLWGEIFDNAVDELLCGYGNAINVSINTSDNSITIYDDGRGIPLTKKDGMWVPVLIMSKMFTSGKFKKNVNAYKVSSGLHGIGATAVNALSSSVTMLINNSKKKGQFDFKDSKVVQEIVVNNPNEPTGTMISFIPCKSIFKNINLQNDIAEIINRIRVVNYFLNNKVIFTVDDKHQPVYITNEEYNTFLFNTFTENEKFNESDILSFKVKNGHESAEIQFTYNLKRNDPLYSGSINLLPCHAGTHITWFKSILMDMWCKLYKNKELHDTDYLRGLRCTINLLLGDPKFSSQTKEKLEIDESILNKAFKTEVICKLQNIFINDNNTQLLESWMNKFLEYRRNLNVKKSNKNKKGKKKKITSKLRDCTCKKGGELFIVEGDSAAGSLIQCSDVKKHAIFPLQGKFLNVDKSTISKIGSNKVITELIDCIGMIDFQGGKFVQIADKPKYDKIIICADPDGDGYHIAYLLMVYFDKLMPSLIDDGYIFVSEVPLYSYYNKRKKFMPIWDDKDVDKHRKKGHHICRHKGLGEFSPNELKEVMLTNYKRIQLTHEGDINENNT